VASDTPASSGRIGDQSVVYQTCRTRPLHM